MNKEYWTTKEGEKIDIDDMSVEHLRNALKSVVRNQRRMNEKVSRENNYNTDRSRCRSDRHNFNNFHGGDIDFLEEFGYDSSMFGYKE